MPGRNGTGPMGAGAMTGRSLGPCAGTGSLAKGAGLGLGLGMACRRGFGRGFRQFPAGNELSAEDRKGLLQLQKNALKNRLADIDRQLESL
ncbi:DUF5320 domain-containing protein [Caproicibacter fermentans]|uniref:DUF5320 domain-containing protein n=1 Tax=Caproicibacter fermentans TaxID=2576756 RepID=A0A7G8T8K8_9FIRM|nr:DUF5320 domain-containing protein [Caproicibacter fermentans]QNK39949.1 DUF5320 domain-containing protein [Caproicibacter fermentans]